jgi:hypothetical protein
VSEDQNPFEVYLDDGPVPDIGEQVAIVNFVPGYAFAFVEYDLSGAAAAKGEQHNDAKNDVSDRHCSSSGLTIERPVWPVFSNWSRERP